MNSIYKGILWWLFSVFVLYLGMSFAAWQLNPGLWNEEYRFFTALVSILVAVPFAGIMAKHS